MTARQTVKDASGIFTAAEISQMVRTWTTTRLIVTTRWVDPWYSDNYSNSIMFGVPPIKPHVCTIAAVASSRKHILRATRLLTLTISQAGRPAASQEISGMAALVLMQTISTIHRLVVLRRSSSAQTHRSTIRLSLTCAGNSLIRGSAASTICGIGIAGG